MRPLNPMFGSQLNSGVASPQSGMAMTGVGDDDPDTYDRHAMLESVGTAR